MLHVCKLLMVQRVGSFNLPWIEYHRWSLTLLLTLALFIFNIPYQPLFGFSEGLPTVENSFRGILWIYIYFRFSYICFELALTDRKLLSRKPFFLTRVFDKMPADPLHQRERLHVSGKYSPVRSDVPRLHGN